MRRAAVGRRFRLEWVAPRLALARDQRVAELEAERRARSRAREKVLKAERLVAHRELHLARVTATVSGRADAYRILDRRERKLEAAREELACAQRHAAELGA